MSLTAKEQAELEQLQAELSPVESALTPEEQAELEQLQYETLYEQALAEQAGEQTLREPEPMLDTAVRQFVSGGTQNFSDETLGLIDKYLSKNKEYKKTRDIERMRLGHDFTDNPVTANIAYLAGSLMSPANRLVRGMGPIGGSTALGALMGLGGSRAEDAVGMATDTALGAGLGAGFAKGAQYLGPKLKTLAEKMAYKSSMPGLAAVKADKYTGKDTETGRWMLDKGVTKLFGTIGGVENRAEALQTKAGDSLNNIYAIVDEAFKSNKVGFDPLRDKQKILQQADEALGVTEGKQQALNRLSNYIDERVLERGDAPAQTAMQKYRDEISKYVPEFRQYLKNLKEYKNAYGSAADDASQPILPGMVDDLQRTSIENQSIPVQGKIANVLAPQPPAPPRQMNLPILPTRPNPAPFNEPRGDDLLPLLQAMDLDAKQKFDFFKLGKQGHIINTGLIPNKSRNFKTTKVGGDTGQVYFTPEPTAPTRPIKPKDIKNPMSPSETRKMITALDERIKYSANPLSPDPATEKSFYGGRKYLRSNLDDTINKLGGDDIYQAYKDANLDYGMSSKVKENAFNALAAQDKNRILSPTDWAALISALGISGIGASQNDLSGGVGVGMSLFAGKKAFDKMGMQTGAKIIDKASTQKASELFRNLFLQQNTKEKDKEK